MRKDWVVWVGCVSLFATGVIWGRVPIATDFFKVKDIHDLFEVAGAGATVIAVCLAVAGLNAWRLETLATSDHDLARRAAIALHGYKSAVIRGCQVAEFLVDRIIETGKYKAVAKSHQFEDMKKEFESLNAAITSAKAVALECKVVWGESVWAEFQSVLVPGGKYLDCIDGYLRLSRDGVSDTAKEAIAEQVSDSLNYLIPIVGLGKASVEQAMDEALSPLYSEIQKRFLRRNAS
ncbi:hypothetical protein [Pseudomonas rubra]|uniref:Uncharacterized protein n=1 Tax=Pseudomonas rubra TaxID=2942627 RepID=A0ABT5P216_9PSED|nr:hypothetical protein [Pseudomonas rubra]MDD1012212.1 hypothetical protein [Pseudomonas rubra]MDD1038352.1 hypothetical protein [Pseudomonas rubra]MDD1153388.1 hypothetical protein [Pseudomonas rubra]